MRVAPLLLLTLFLVPLVPAQSVEEAPCATNAATEVASEGRFFCEPMDSLAFLQFAQLEAGLEYLESQHPELIEIKVIGESVLGRPLYFVEVTNEDSPVPREEKLQIGYSASIHANEAAGREGMARMIEDLVMGIGPHGAELQPLLDQVIVNTWFPNPDSWANGDFFSSDDVIANHECERGTVDALVAQSPSTGYCADFDRENALGVDLNREFPNPGLIHKDHTPMSEPESQAVVKELRFSGDHSNLVAGMDLHGMINSQNMIRSIIPNQDYDFRRMVLAVDMLKTMEERITDDPAYADWNQADSLEDLIGETTDVDIGGTSDAALEKPMQWGARWDMIGYTDTGFTSDYLMLSPRSPTGGMGAIGTITEFAYSHEVPDNHYVAKLTDMHVAGVRQMVRTQMELAGRLDTPVMAGTGAVAFLDDGSSVSSDDDPAAYEVSKTFDIDDESTWFDFDQVEYDVSNLRFWRDLARFSQDPIEAIPTDGFEGGDLAGYDHLVITNQTLDALDEVQVNQIEGWVNTGGHLLLTDSALRFFERAGFGGEADQVDTYLGYSDVQDWEHELVDGVTWGARVTGEGPAIGMNVGSYYPQWVLSTPPGGEVEVVGTTMGQPSLGRLQHGEGSIDFLGGALPMPRQVSGDNADHRYGLADYSVSAFTYWIVMNSLGGHVEWQPISEPFIPTYDFDPIYGPDGAQTEEDEGPAKKSPAVPVALVGAALAAVAVALRRRRD